PRRRRRSTASRFISVDAGAGLRCPRRMATRTLRIGLESGDFDTNAIEVAELSGKEAIGRLFHFDVFVICKDVAGLDPHALVGAGAALVFELTDTAAGAVIDTRRVHGILAEIEDMLDTETEHRTYRLRLVPRAHRSTMVETQEIFLSQSVPEIILQKLAR